MTQPVQIQQILVKRGNTASIASYTGPLGELVLNTQTNQLVAQDGVTAGGHLVTGDTLPIMANLAGLQTEIANIAGITGNVYQLEQFFANVNLAAITSSISTLQILASGNYGNSNVATYLASGTNSTINSLNTGLASVNANVTAANAAIITANLSLKNYVDTKIALLANAPAILDTLGQIATAIQGDEANIGTLLTNLTSTNANIAAANAAIVTANTAVVSYVNTKVANLQSQITANATGVSAINSNIGSFYTYANVTYSTVANAASQQTQIVNLQSQVYANANTAAYLPIYGGNISVANVTFGGGNALRIVPVPVSLAGQAGDRLGDVAFSANYMYYCTATYPYSSPITITNQGDYSIGGGNFQLNLGGVPSNQWTALRTAPYVVVKNSSGAPVGTVTYYSDNGAGSFFFTEGTNNFGGAGYTYSYALTANMWTQTPLAATTYANANVASYLSTYAGNISANIFSGNNLILANSISMGGNIYGNGRIWVGDSFQTYSNITISSSGWNAARSINLIDTAAVVKIVRVHDSSSPSIEMTSMGGNGNIRSRFDFAVSTIPGQDMAAFRWLTANSSSTGGADRIQFFSNSSPAIVYVPVNQVSSNTGSGAFVVSGGVGIGGDLNLGGNLFVGNNTTTGNIIPQANNVYSLGSVNNQWASLFVSNNTIYIGGQPLSVSGGQLLLNGTAVGSGVYGNANVAAYTAGNLAAINANITAANASISSLQANVGSFYTWANTNFGSSSYANANVAAYLSTYAGNIAGNIVHGGNAWVFDNNGGLTLPWNSSTNVGGYIYSVKTIQGTTASSGATISGFSNVSAANFTFGNGVNILSTIAPSSTYSNANVTAYLTTASITTTGSITAGNLTTSGTYTVANITTTGAYGNITGANVISANTVTVSNGIFWSNGVAFSSGSTYGNTQVASYLVANPPAGTYTDSSVASYLGTVGSGTSFRLGSNSFGAPNVILDTNNGVTVSAMGSAAGVVNLTASSAVILSSLMGNVYVPSGSVLTTVGGIKTNNYFWANGVAVSFGGGGGGTTYSNANVASYIGATTFSTVSASVLNSVGQINGTLVYIQTNGTNNFLFDNTGNLVLPTGGSINYANGRNILTGISSSGTTYSNTNVAAYLTTATITTTGNITAGNITAGYFYGNGAALSGLNYASIGNIYGSSSNVTLQAGTYNWTFDNTGNLTIPTTGNIIWANGTVFSSGTGGGGGSSGGTVYSNANVVSMLSANTAVFIGNTGNVATVYPIQSNITQMFIGGNTLLTSGNAASPNSTFLMYNGYFAANGAIVARNTTTGIGYIVVDSTGIAFNGYTGAVTANTVPTFNQFLKMNGSIGAQFSGAITTPGSVTAAGFSLSSGSFVTSLATLSLFNATATTINMGQVATTITLGSATPGSLGNVFVANAIGTTNGNLTIRARGTYNTFAGIVNSSGGYNSPPYNNQATTGGSGTGMIVNLTGVVGGYPAGVTVVNPGTGYKNGDVISVTGGASFTLANYNPNFTNSPAGQADYLFGMDGNLYLPGNVTHATNTSIYGDFTNSTVNNRTMFRPIAANANPGIYAVPSGTGTAASWQAANSSDLTNASKILISTNGTTDVQLVSGINGTGTYLPLSFYTNGGNQMQLGTGGNLFMVTGGNISTTGNVIAGNVVSTGVITTGGTLTASGGIVGTPIGQSRPSSGSFIVLSSTSTTTLGATTATSIDSTPIGNTTASIGKFTSLNIGWWANIANGAPSTSSTSGALVVGGAGYSTGGVGISGNVWTGGSINSGAGFYSTGQFNGGYSGVGLVADYTLGKARISAGSTTGSPIAYNLTANYGSGGDYTPGDLKTDASSANVVNATVSAGWSANAIAAFSSLLSNYASATNVSITLAGIGSSPVTALSNVSYFAGNTTYVLTFVSSINLGFTSWTIDGITMTLPGTASKDSISFYTNGVANTEVLKIDGNSGNLVIPAATASTSTTTGALVVKGGVGVAGNITAGNITANQYGNSIGTFATYSGNATTGYSAINTGPTGYTVLPFTPVQITGNGNTYVQMNQQNISSGNQSTTDYVATADIGTNTTYFVDLGIAGSNYSNVNPNNSLGTSLWPNDAYLYTAGNTSANVGGNLVVGTQTSGRTVKILAGGINSNNVVATFSNTGTTITGNVITSGYGFFPGVFQETSTSSGVFVGNTGTGTGTPRVAFFNGNTTQNWQIDNYNGAFRWFTPGVTRMSLDGNTNQLTVSGNVSSTNLIASGDATITGNVTISGINSGYAPNRPAFRITGNGGSISSTTTVSGGYMVVDYNQGSYLNTSTGLFTAPVAGLYQVNLVVRAASNTGPTAQIIVRKTTAIGNVTTAQIMIEYAANTTMNHTGGSTLVKMAVGDTLKFDVTVGTISFDGNDNWSVAYIG